MTWARAHTVCILRYFFWLILCALSMPLFAARAATSNGELPRAAVPRPLRLVAADGAPLSGLPTDVAWERRGGGVFFTLERGGTRNIWRAFPDPQDESRFPAWRALPVTDLRAPRYAAQPCPLPGDRALVCVSNVLASAPATVRVAQIVRYDLTNAQFRALSDGVRLYETPQVSPDGMRVAFAGGQGAEMRAFIASTQNPINRVMPDVTPVAARARRPVWLDNNTLLIENLAPDARGLYWMQPGGAPRVVVGGGGEANTLGENGIVFSAKTNWAAPPSLYVVARDGSGLRVLNETRDARRPATSPDGQTLAFDAPQGQGRALWVVPLLRAESRDALGTRAVARLVADDAPQYDVPTAQLASARAASEGIAIIGNLRGAANSTILLEVGEGEKPRRWESLKVPFPPTSALLDTQGNRVLTFWNPPPRARGVWTLRLSLSGLGGGAQSLLRVKLPLPAQQALPPLPAPVGLPPARADNPQVEPLPRATPLPMPPDVVPVRGTFVPPLAPPDEPLFALPPVSTSGANDVPAFPSVVPPASAQIPPIIASVPPPNSPPVAPVRVPSTLPTRIVPIDPSRIAPQPVVAPNSPSIVPPSAPDDSDYGDAPAVTGAPFVAQFNVSGTPARMAPRETAKVTFWGLNRGTSTWETGSGGANRVRVVARWVDFSTGTRRQWNFFWLRESVAPGERTKWEFDLPAPARPGKYKLIYGLVKLPASGEYAPPAYNAPQEAWDNEFGAIAFAVEVGANAG